MKLKNVLVMAFLTLTLIPAILVSVLLYKSGYGLSKESYTRNLEESINVQADYISQTIENNMISDYRFANRKDVLLSDPNTDPVQRKNDLLTAFQSYLETSADKIAACALIGQDNQLIYTIGEKRTLDILGAQMPDLKGLTEQIMVEFELEPGEYSMGTVTPVWDKEKRYVGSLISVYDKSYVFKIISSYYEIADTSTYICRENGQVVNYRGVADEVRSAATTAALDGTHFEKEGTLDLQDHNIPVSGYYKNIGNSSWYLVGFISDKLVFSFVNRFIIFYFFIILGILTVDILLAIYFSRKVVQPINSLIQVMDGYQNGNDNPLEQKELGGYFETKYLQRKFYEMIKRISLVQHNFEGIFQLYQSSDMGDTNIDIDVKNQTVSSNKEIFGQLMERVDVPEDACIVETFINCFDEKGRGILTDMFESMRDEHLSVACETELYTPCLEGKWYHTLVVPMYENDRLSRLFVQLRDISGFKKQELQSSEQARRDPLTGLYNRTGFASCVEEILQTEGESNLHGLLFIDMDFFKLVNDNFGHIAGDELLRSVGKTLVETVDDQVVVSRFGGDEFALFMPHTCPEDIAALKAKLGKLLIYPYSTEESHFVISASIGVSTWKHEATDTLEKLLEQADAAMYSAKKAYKEQLSK